MALTIQVRRWKNADGSVTESWRLQIQDFTSGRRVCHYPAKQDLPKYGFDPDESLDSARAKLKIIQAQNRLDRNMERRARIDHRIKFEALKESAHLPKRLYVNFLTWLKERRMWDDIPAKTDSHLRCMRKLILEIECDPSDWSTRPERVYNAFRKRRLSLSYIEKVLPLLNAYGYFYCRELKKAFMPLAFPRGELARRIEEANFDANDGKSKASKPILPEMLPKLMSLPEDQLRWVRLSVFFGLRPSEIDRMGLAHKEKLWKLTTDRHRTYVLCVFQSKLTRIERERRWKRIPCILKEQRQLANDLKQGLPIKRPYVKTLRYHLGEGYGLYGGRKGFDRAMRDRGQKFDNVSRWLGHTDIKRTERHYRDFEAVEYDPVPRS